MGWVSISVYKDWPSRSIVIALYTVSKLLGHKTIQATQIYAKIVDEKKKAAMELLPVIEISS